MTHCKDSVGGRPLRDDHDGNRIEKKRKQDMTFYNYLRVRPTQKVRKELTLQARCGGGSTKYGKEVRVKE